MGLKTALILSGGGARGAYQVGVLKGLAEILPEKKKSPFQILSGVSAGAINCSKLASEIEHFSNAVEKLIYLWSQISSDQVFKTDFLSLNKFSLGLFGERKLNSVLETAPLRELINRNCDFAKIKKNLENEIIEAVIITANNYEHSSAVSFIQTLENHSVWKESRRQAKRTIINADHIMASSAIPMLFPPIRIGNQFYGDGCVRNNTPCSPSIRMGAEKLFVIGVRQQLSAETSAGLENESEKSPSMIRILNTLLNAVLLDSVEQDVMRIQRINQLTQFVESKKKLASGLKEIPALCIAPSQDIGEIARAHAHRLPRLLRMTISAFGSLDDASEILSYLLFEPNFCKQLIDMGYHDAMESKSQIKKFFAEGVS
ncbi:MAG: patatin-like phospholipase family protein [Bdellovibrionaceae bacterium]|nr:patatin-like phospholipase family protein [Bdellovibrio sp.]